MTRKLADRRQRRRQKAVFVGLVLALTTLALAASSLADTTTVRDKRNTRLNRFDIRSATAGHSGGLLEHTIRTYRSWPAKELRSTEDEPRDICVYIWRAKSDPTQQQDYQVCAHREDGKLQGSVFHVRAPHRRTGHAFVRRFDDNSITYRFEKTGSDERLVGKNYADDIRLGVAKVGEKGEREVVFKVFTGDNARDPQNWPDLTINPLFIWYLDRAVSTFNSLAGGSHMYLKHKIREALANAEAEPIKVDYDGKPIDAILR